MSIETLTCPKCSSKFGISGFFILRIKELPCPNCDAILSVAGREETLHKEKAPGAILAAICIFSVIFSFYTLIILGDCLACAISLVVLSLVSIPPLRALSIVNKNMKKLVVVRLRPSCGNCGYIMAIENAGFCPKCGADLLSSGQPHSARAEEVWAPGSPRQLPNVVDLGKCMICTKDLSPHDTVAPCPFCGSTFHLTHLLEYLHVHGGCPACGKPIDEMASMHQLSHEATQPEEGNKWMEMSPS
jgi:Zn finger protein HypA/HybF involved in hydrogenase expression